MGEVLEGKEGREGMEMEPSDPSDPRELCGGPFMSKMSGILRNEGEGEVNESE